MKPIICYFFIFSLALISCKKDNGKNQKDTSSKNYVNTAQGSVWNYHEINSSSGTPSESDYSITSTAKDTTIGTKNYHVYTYSYGGSKYLGKSNDDYFEYADFSDLGQTVERLYLKGKSPVNTTWSQEFNVPVPGLPIPATMKVKIENQIVDIGSRIVNGNTYNDVMHVKTTLSSSDIPSDNLTTNINSYFAPDYGLIENTTIVNLNLLGGKINIDMQTLLKSATLKQ